MRLFALLICLGFSSPLISQVVNTGFVDTTGGEHLGRITLGACVDAYGNSSGAGKTLPYMVSSAENNTFGVNLAMLDIRYQTAGVRARLVPAFGTYMNANLPAHSKTYWKPVWECACLKNTTCGWMQEFWDLRIPMRIR
ncbi:MAG: hypothetical protein RIT07_1331 [Bacteroidota bacterium]